MNSTKLPSTICFYHYIIRTVPYEIEDNEFLFFIPAQSPLVGLISSSLDGLTTIRAFGEEQILKNEFDKNQDVYTSTLMTMKISMIGFNFTINFLSTTLVVSIILWFIFFEAGMLPFPNH